MEKIINKWHSILDMPKKDLAWHEADVLDEMQELREAKKLMKKWMFLK